jgi:hypothetical protein
VPTTTSVPADPDGGGSSSEVGGGE